MARRARHEAFMTVREVPPLREHEARVLLASGRRSIDAGVLAALASFDDVSWETLAWYARLHSVGPLVHAAIDEGDGWRPLPAAARKAFLRLAHRSAYQQHVFGRENASLLDAFHRDGVPVIVQKGVSLAEHVYGRPALRPLIDLVFLVPEEAGQQAALAFRRSGWTLRPTGAGDMVYRWCCPQLVFEAKREFPVVALVQWNLVNWPRLHGVQMAPLFARATRTTVSGQPAMMLSPEDQVLYLCLQADNHGFFNRTALETVDPMTLLFAAWSNNRQIRFVDLFETIRHYREAIDWEVLAERALAGGVAGAVRASLMLTNALLGFSAPAQVLDQLPAGETRRLRRWVFEAVAADALDATGATTAVSAHGGRRAARRPRLRRLAANWLMPRFQIQGGRLISLFEYCFPSRQDLRASRRGAVHASALPARIAHSAGAVTRSVSSFVSRKLGRRAAFERRLLRATGDQ